MGLGECFRITGFNNAHLNEYLKSKGQIYFGTFILALRTEDGFFFMVLTIHYMYIIINHNLYTFGINNGLQYRYDY